MTTTDTGVTTTEAAAWLGVSVRRLDYLSRRGTPGTPPCPGSGSRRSWSASAMRKLYVATTLYRQLGALAPEWSTLAARLLEGPEPPGAGYVWLEQSWTSIILYVERGSAMPVGTSCGLVGCFWIPDLPI